MTKKILVLSLDYDDCLLRKYDRYDHLRREKFDAVDFDEVVNNYQAPKGKIKWKKRLLKDNKALFAYISSIAANYDEIIVCCGSNRQNEYSDATNSCRDDLYSGSCYEGLEILVSHLRTLVGVPVQLEQTTTADHFLQRKSGETFSSTLEWAKGLKPKSSFKDCPNDRTKISLHYRLMHYFADKLESFWAKQKEEVKIDYFAIDDSYQGQLKLPNPAIIDGLNEVYRERPQLIPDNTSLFTLPYQNGELKMDCMTKIEGTGAIDRNFDFNMERMMLCSLKGDEIEQRIKLFDRKSCNCWNVFANHKKEEAFFRNLQDPETAFVNEFIERHKLAYSSGFFCGLFNKTNLSDYETLNTRAILKHAKHRTFFGFKNRTCQIVEEMGYNVEP
ncbi:hypothetical protein [Legionella drozanskii]|uniref:Dot/Icm T4SS effector n=1 Tax=Legionella drozanskii LLAP-1 TaxID=1212489 RepID=A0A0W0TDT1_9GAMM|nr:hypothetical protein [Legionella drozanskii]KTC93759.1 hypothetical protein Ldro_0109 [Legionella drozanskii LLAP-1]